MDSFTLGLVLVFMVAVLTGMFFRLIGLPSLVGQVVAGLIIGGLGMVNDQGVDSMRHLGSLGVTLLLFLVGLELNLKELKSFGVTVVRLFLVHFLFLSSAFFGLSLLVFRLSVIPTLFLAITLSFSSTIVVIKTLSEKKDLGSYAGKLSLGILLLQDVVALLMLVLLPSMGRDLSIWLLANLLFKLVMVFSVIYVMGHYLMLLVEKFLVKTADDLVLISLVWFGFSVYFAVDVLGLTPEIGGILAGLSLSSSWGRFQIVSKVKPLRDIFLTVFFVLLGLEVGVSQINWFQIFLVVLGVLVLKFVLTWIVCLWNKFPGKVAFSVALNMTQISEFGMIVASFGVVAGFWDGRLVSVVTISALVSMVMSTVIMSNSSRLYKFLSLKFPKRPGTAIGRASREGRLMAGHVVLFGGDRTGRSILSVLKKNGERVLVIDFNPETVRKLRDRGEVAILEDASDPDILDVVNLDKAKMVVSTIKDVDDSLSLLTLIRQRGLDTPVIVDAETPSQAAMLYSAGASYVVFPHFVSGLHLGTIMKKFEKDVEVLKKYRERQGQVLKEIYENDFV